MAARFSKIHGEVIQERSDVLRRDFIQLSGRYTDSQFGVSAVVAFGIVHCVIVDDPLMREHAFEVTLSHQFDAANKAARATPALYFVVSGFHLFSSGWVARP